MGKRGDSQTLYQVTWLLFKKQDFFFIYIISILFYQKIFSLLNYLSNLVRLVWLKRKKYFLLQDFWCANMEIFLLYNKPIFSSSSQEIEVIINLGAFLLTALPSLREVRCHFEATDQKIRKSPICVLQHGRRTLGMEKKVKEKKKSHFSHKVFLSNWFFKSTIDSPEFVVSWGLFFWGNGR